MSYLNLRLACVECLKSGGVNQLRRPNIFRSVVLDLADHTLPETQLFSLQFDDDLARYLIDAAASPTPTSLDTARARMITNLTNTRFVNERVATRMADEVVGAFADYARVSLRPCEFCRFEPANPAPTQVVQPAAPTQFTPTQVAQPVAPARPAPTPAMRPAAPMQPKPVLSSNPRRVVSVAANRSHTVGLRADGTVVACGSNKDGKCDLQSWRDIVRVVAGERFTAGLTKQGEVLIAGHIDSQKAWLHMVAIAAGRKFLAGVCRDGTILIQGKDTWAVADAYKWRDIIQIVAGNRKLLGLKGDGTVAIAGDLAGTEEAKAVRTWSGISSLATGNAWSMGIRRNGTLELASEPYCPFYHVDDLVRKAPFVAVDAGERHVIGLRAGSGVVVGCGEKKRGQLNIDGWNNVVAIAAGSYHTVAVRADGKVLATGDNAFQQCNVASW